MGTAASSIPDPPRRDATDDDCNDCDDSGFGQIVATPPLSPTPMRRSSPPPPPTPRKLPRDRFLLCLDVQTTGEDRPHLLSVEAVMYRYDAATGTCNMEGEMASVVVPREGHSGARHLHDMRAHGLTAERLAREGKRAAEVVDELVDLIRRTTGLNDEEDYERVVRVVGHGAKAMMSNLMVTLVVDAELGRFYETFVGLCRHPECTMEMAVRMHPGLPRYTLEGVLLHLGHSVPDSRGEAVARLYFGLQKETRDTSGVLAAVADALRE